MGEGKAQQLCVQKSEVARRIGEAERSITMSSKQELCSKYILSEAGAGRLQAVELSETVSVDATASSLSNIGAGGSLCFD